MKLNRKLLIMIITSILLLRERHKLTVEVFIARLVQAKLITKADIADFVKKTYFDKKLKIKIQSYIK